MKVIAGRIYREPAVFIGLVASVALLVIKLLTGDPWDAATIAGIAAPLASALGIRSLVSPASGSVEAVVVETESTPVVKSAPELTDAEIAAKLDEEPPASK